MGNFFIKCKECLVFLRPKPISAQPVHQLVNLSNNPAEESQGKIDAQQISFTQEAAQSNDQTITQSGEVNVNDVTLEIVDNKQLSALRSPQTNQNPNQNDQNQFVLNEECKTDPNLESPALLSFKKTGIITYPSQNLISLQEMNKYGREALEQLIEIYEQGFHQYEFQNNTKNIDLYFSHYIIGKRTIVQVKFELNINTNINNFLQWSNSNTLFDFDLIQSYSLQPLNEQISIGEIILKKHMMIKNQVLSYFKYLETYNQDFYIVFKAFRLDDRYYQLNISDKPDQLSEGEIMLGGLKLIEKNGQLNIIGYLEADFLIKVGFNLAAKKLREIAINLIVKVKSIFD